MPRLLWVICTHWLKRMHVSSLMSLKFTLNLAVRIYTENCLERFILGPSVDSNPYFIWSWTGTLTNFSNATQMAHSINCKSHCGKYFLFETCFSVVDIKRNTRIPQYVSLCWAMSPLIMNQYSCVDCLFPLACYMWGLSLLLWCNCRAITCENCKLRGSSLCNFISLLYIPS
jgi:hypothetical protein